MKNSNNNGDELVIRYILLEDDDKNKDEIEGIIDKIVESIYKSYKEDSSERINITRLTTELILWAKNEEEVLTCLSKSKDEKGSEDKNSFPDLIILDNNLPDSRESGLQTLKEISRKKYPIDCILYTNLDEAPENAKDIVNLYGRNWLTTYDDLIESTLKYAITKFYISWSNPEYLRGMILSRFADLDLAWNELALQLLVSKQGELVSEQGDSEAIKELLRIFALTRNGMGITQKAKNSVDVYNKIVCPKKSQNNGPEKPSKSVEYLKNRTIDLAKTRNDFAHNSIKKIYEGNKIMFENKIEDEYTRECVKGFLFNLSHLISEIQEFKEYVEKNL